MKSKILLIRSILALLLFISFAVLLEAVRDAQLNESIKDRDEALLLVDRLCDDQDWTCVKSSVGSHVSN